jgi:deoxyadenosine/deoxycytidine kinase
MSFSFYILQFWLLIEYGSIITIEYKFESISSNKNLDFFYRKPKTCYSSTMMWFFLLAYDKISISCNGKNEWLSQNISYK